MRTHLIVMCFCALGSAIYIAGDYYDLNYYILIGTISWMMAGIIASVCDNDDNCLNENKGVTKK